MDEIHGLLSLVWAFWTNLDMLVLIHIVRARPIEITIKKQWFPTLKPRISVKNSVGMVKSDLDALAPCALKSSE